MFVVSINAGMMEAQQRRQRLQAEEEAVNTAIIQETEEELQQINRSLYKVLALLRFLAVPKGNILPTSVDE